MSVTDTDRIEKSIVLKAPRSRVWRALVTPEQFQQWHGVRLHGEFVTGESVSGTVTHPGYEHIRFNVTVERMEPERVLAWRWHVLVDATSGQQSEQATLVEFTLEDVEGGTLLTVVESGFDSLPPEYRDAVWRSNENGWSEQMESIAQFIDAAN